MSSIINKALLLENLKRFWAIAVIPLVIYAIVVYAPIVSANSIGSAITSLVNVITMNDFGMMFTAILTPVAAVFCVFGIFFNKTAANVMYSFPFNKRQLYITNAISGLILSLVPVLIFCIVLLFPMSFHDEWYAQHQEQMQTAISRGHISADEALPFVPQLGAPVGIVDVLLPNGPTEGAPLNSFPLVAGLFLRLALTTVFYFGVAWLAFSLAGSGFVALLLTAAVPIVPASIMLLVDFIGMRYVFGYQQTSFMDFQRFFIVYHNPALWGPLLLRTGGFTRMNAIILPYIFNMVIGAGIFVTAYFVSRARKTERTGNAVVFNPVKTVCIFLLSFTAMVITGVIFYAVTETVVMFRVGLVVGFIGGFIVAQMIAEKTLRVLSKMRYLPHFLGTAVAMYLVMFIFTQWGMGFYTNRVPAQDNVYGVIVSGNWWWSTDNDMLREISHTDPAVIAEVRRVHQIIVDNSSELHAAPNFHLSAHRFDGTHWRQMGENVIFNYILQNGRMVMRRYIIPFDFMEQTGIYEFFYSAPVVFMEYPALQNPHMVANLSIFADINAWNAETGRTEYIRSERFILNNSEQIEQVLQIAGEIALENARNNFYFHRSTTSEDFTWGSAQGGLYDGQEIVYIHLNSSFQFANDPGHSGWRIPSIFGEQATIVLEMAREWGTAVDLAFVEYDTQLSS